MSKYTDFKAQVLGKGFDVDGAYGWQCFDGYAQYCKFLGVPYANCTTSGYVKDIWNNRHSNGMLNYFDEVSVMEPGDIAVFKEVAGVTPVSHIAIFDSDIDGVNGNFLGQNQGGTAYAGGGAAFNITSLPYSATFDTAFRLKTKNNGGQSMTATKRVNGDLFSGLITDVDPNIMNADNNRTKIDRIIIHHNATTNDAVARSTWYVSSGHGTSAHYQVTPNKIWGCVGEESVAYHAGNYPMNQRSIGIEHLNNTGAPTWTIAEETYQNSAKLIADIATRYNIPIDRAHILKHGEVSQTACPGGINIDRLVSLAKQYQSNGAPTVKKSAEPTAKVKVETVNYKDKAFAIRLYDVKSPDGIKKVQFPVWTENKGQDDLKWNDAVKQADGTWLFVDNAKNHKGELGKYNVHAYITTPDGASHGVATTTTTLTPSVTGKLSIKDIDAAAGTFVAELSEIKSPVAIKGIKFPVWTDDKGQDDLKWYNANKNTDGSYSVVVPIKNHGNKFGTYNVHCYADIDGATVGVAGTKAEFKEQPKTDNSATEKPEIIVVTKGDATVKTVVLSQEEFDKIKK